ncbi:MAG: hypothetical protein K0S01_1998 [Herbinix sp.]|jgi:hypothetical protein|nr:hypothetical protein [Herbinix sp.]
MNLPFGLPAVKEIGLKKRDGSIESAALYERKLLEYRDTLENYKKCILEYSGKLEGYDRRTVDNQLSIVQTALDLTYIKEQGERTVDLLEDLKDGHLTKSLIQLEGLITAMVDTNYKLEGLDKNVVNRLSEMLLELQKQTVAQNKQLQSELITGIEKLTKTVKKGHTLLWFLIIFNILGLSGLAFLVLYIMEIIPF